MVDMNASDGGSFKSDTDISGSFFVAAFSRGLHFPFFSPSPVVPFFASAAHFGAAPTTTRAGTAAACALMGGGSSYYRHEVELPRW